MAVLLGALCPVYVGTAAAGQSLTFTDLGTILNPDGSNSTKSR